MRKILPTIPEGLGSPFYYGSLSSLALFFSVPTSDVELGANSNLFDPVEISNIAIAAVSFQRYFADFGDNAVIVNELELSTVVVPKTSAKDFSTVALDEFVRGEEQSLTLGHLPVAVACDAKPAVDAGIGLFGEPKFLATMSSQAPSPNDGSGDRSWMVSYSRDGKDSDFTVKCELPSVHPTLVNSGIVTTYGCVEGNPIGSRWAIYQAALLHFPISQQDSVSFDVHDTDPTVSSFLNSVRNGSIVAARECRTPPVAARGRPYSV